MFVTYEKFALYTNCKCNLDSREVFTKICNLNINYTNRYKLVENYINHFPIVKIAVVDSHFDSRRIDVYWRPKNGYENPCSLKCIGKTSNVERSMQPARYMFAAQNTRK